MKWAWISPVLWLAMVASLLWMRAMISVREWALPMPRWRSFPEWRRVGLLRRRTRRHACSEVVKRGHCRRELEARRKEYIREFAFGADGGSTERVVEALRGVPDALLHQTAEQLHQLEKQEEGPPVLGMFAYLLEVEVDTRRVFARAREVGADTYCVYHDGDLKDCAAEHFDGEDA